MAKCSVCGDAVCDRDACSFRIHLDETETFLVCTDCRPRWTEGCLRPGAWPTDHSKEELRSTVCVICVDAHNIVVTDCSRRAVCRSCSTQLTGCPVCRGRVSAWHDHRDVTGGCLSCNDGYDVAAARIIIRPATFSLRPGAWPTDP